LGRPTLRILTDDELATWPPPSKQIHFAILLARAVVKIVGLSAGEQIRLPEGQRLVSN
jgi:hypothetical protein